MDGIFTELRQMVREKARATVPTPAPVPKPTPTPRPRFRLPPPTQAALSGFFREATRGGGVSAKVIENVYRGAERYRTRPKRGVDPNRFIVHELVERLLMKKGIPFPKRHEWVAKAEAVPVGTPTPTPTPRK